MDVIWQEGTFTLWQPSNMMRLSLIHRSNCKCRGHLWSCLEALYEKEGRIWIFSKWDYSTYKYFLTKKSFMYYLFMRADYNISKALVYLFYCSIYILKMYFMVVISSLEEKQKWSLGNLWGKLEWEVSSPSNPVNFISQNNVEFAPTLPAETFVNGIFVHFLVFTAMFCSYHL